MSNTKIISGLKTNRVDGKNAKIAIQRALRLLKDAVAPSAGPFGSQTQIITMTPGKQVCDKMTEYTKDGHKIGHSVMIDQPIEDSIQKEMVEATRYIVKTVGDGTTSTFILSSLIYDQFLSIDANVYPAYKVIEEFKKVVAEMKTIINSYAKPLTLEDAKKILTICTNSNDRTVEALYQIYSTFGTDVFINLETSSGEDDYVKSYDGFSLAAGYSDVAYINKIQNATVNADSKEKSEDSVCEIHNPRIYAFSDPIDTPEMINFVMRIFDDNIRIPFSKMMNGTKAVQIPTVIIVPKLGYDAQDAITVVNDFMYTVYNTYGKQLKHKPKFNIVVAESTEAMENVDDIIRMCGCKKIHKYIDFKQQEKDQQQGTAPTLETISENFYGTADLVVSTSDRTTFVNPYDMYDRYEEDVVEDGIVLFRKGEIKVDENGELVKSAIYMAQMDFLEKELKSAIAKGDSADTIGAYRSRLNAFKCNLVDYFVGGLTATDRIAAYDLADDAIKNVRSAAKYGIGNGTNFEGLRAIETLYNEDDHTNELRSRIIFMVRNAFYEITELLYKTVYYEGCTTVDEKNEKVKNLIKQSLAVGMPMNFKTQEFSGDVLCTIEQDKAILDVLSKVISIIFTSNQSLVQSYMYNVYSELDADTFEVVDDSNKWWNLETCGK